MGRTRPLVVVGIVALGVMAFGRDAKAQYRRGALAAPTASPITNPYMSPYANPYLNPALTVGSTNRNDALLYLWAAQQQPGALLGPPLPGQNSGAGRGLPAATVGGGASRYFQRGPSVTRTGSSAAKFGDRGRYYANPGQ